MDQSRGSLENSVAWRCLSVRLLWLALALALVVGAGLTAGHIWLDEAPLQGISGLLSLYGATVALGFGFALLSQLEPPARIFEELLAARQMTAETKIESWRAARPALTLAHSRSRNVRPAA